MFWDLFDKGFRNLANWREVYLMVFDCSKIAFALFRADCYIIPTIFAIIPMLEAGRWDTVLIAK